MSTRGVCPTVHGRLRGRRCPSSPRPREPPFCALPSSPPLPRSSRAAGVAPLSSRSSLRPSSSSICPREPTAAVVCARGMGVLLEAHLAHLLSLFLKEAIDADAHRRTAGVGLTPCDTIMECKRMESIDFIGYIFIGLLITCEPHNATHTCSHTTPTLGLTFCMHVGHILQRHDCWSSIRTEYLRRHLRMQVFK
jgi:hypothetical protein